MVFSRFRLVMFLRIALIALTMVGVVWSVSMDEPMVGLAAILTMLVVAQLWSTIRYAESITREMTRFLQAVQSEDFTQNFDQKRMGEPFLQLGQALKSVSDRFRSIRAEKEGHDQYVQSVIRQVGTGLISFDHQGDVRLINNAAKSLLGIRQLKHIDQLDQVHPGMTDRFRNLEPGDRELMDTAEGQLSLYATGFTLQGEAFVTVSLQDIAQELDNERMRNELDLAHAVQQQLFPTCPPVRKGLDICGHCIPARETGGDYYDWLDGRDQQLSLIIGDVSGKGMAAAFYMTLCKGFFQSFTDSGLAPAPILEQVNALLSRTMERNRFVSVFFGTVDPGSRQLTYCRAGHNPPLLLRNGETEPEELNARGIALGLEKGLRFNTALQQDALNLAPGDILVCYTDGITEAMDNDDTQYGTGRLARVVVENRNRTATDILNAVFTDVQRFSGQPAPADDMTLIVMSIGASS